MVVRLNGWLRAVPVWAVWLAGLIPLALLIFDTLTGGLGVEPVRDIEHRLGRTAFYFLAGSLAVSPLRRLIGVNLMRFRRALGLLCFSYALLHVLAWISMDMGFLWAQMARDVVKRPYLIVGMLSFVILVALAMTSNGCSIRKMGRRWQSLHRLIYVAAPLAGLHWLWVQKILAPIPAFWTAVILFLIALRGLHPAGFHRKSK